MSRSGDEKVSLVDLGRERPQVPATARNMSPIVPRASISGRALVAVVAIMTFLASLTTGTVLLVSASAAEWQSEVSSEITIQVRPSPGRDLDRLQEALLRPRGRRSIGEHVRRATGLDAVKSALLFEVLPREAFDDASS